MTSASDVRDRCRTAAWTRQLGAGQLALTDQLAGQRNVGEL